MDRDCFKLKTCLHSVSYAGAWRRQAALSVDDFLVKAKQLGYDGTEGGGSIENLDRTARQFLEYVKKFR